jgi:hypothetical protein
MRVVLAAIPAFVLGFAVVYIAVVAGSFWFMSANKIFDRDGGISMAIAFAIGPLCGLIGGTIASAITAIHLGRRERARAAGLIPPVTPWPLPLRLVVAVVAGVAVFYAAWGVLWLLGPMLFRSYYVALAVSYSPLLLGTAVTGFVIYRVLRKRT